MEYSSDNKPSSLYWTREECKSKELSSSIEGPITRAAHIFAIADPEDFNNENLYSGSLHRSKKCCHRFVIRTYNLGMAESLFYRSFASNIFRMTWL